MATKNNAGKTMTKTIFKWFAQLKFAAAVALLMAAGAAQAASLSVEADRTKININDQLEVTFRLKDGPLDAAIDLSPLQKDFDILNTSRRVESYTINWETSRYVLWQVTLAPKRLGELTIPSFTIAKAQSEPLNITVTDAPQTAADAETFLEVTADQTQVFVQQQVLVTARLYSKRNWTAKEIENFNLNYALIEAVDENEYITTLNGVRHRVYEITFAIYPQSSGRLEIPAINYAIQLQSGPSRSFLGSINGPIRRGRSKPLSIDVQSIPDSNGNNTWLPAKNIELSQHFSRSTDSLVAGEPVTRRITIHAQGLHPSQLPPIEFEDIDGISIYHDKPQTDETRSSDGISSTRTETFAIVPNQAGEAQLPAIHLRWYNTETGTYETASLPAVNISATAPAGAATTAAADIAAPPPAQVVTPPPVPAQVIERIPAWMIASQIISGLLVLVLLPMALRKRPATSKKAAVQKEDHHRPTWKMLQKAAQENNLVAFRKAVIEWSSQALGHPVSTLTEVARHLDEDSGQQLLLLDQAIYGTKSGQLNMQNLLKGLRTLKPRKEAADNSRHLQSLYPG